MRWLNRLTMRLRSLFKRSHVERELDAELQFHLDQEIAQHLAAGMSGDRARALAMRSAGSLVRVKEQCRESLGLRLVDELRRDVRYAVRTLFKNPGFTITAVLILALGIGANTAIYTVVDRVLLRPLPYPDAERLAAVTRHYERNGGGTSDQVGQNGATWVALHQAASFMDVGASGGTIGVNLSAGEQPEYVERQPCPRASSRCWACLRHWAGNSLRMRIG